MNKFPFKPNPPYIPDPYVIPQQKQKSNKMKTPEEMAEEYCNTKQLSYVERLVITKGFIDGYQAGREHPFQFQAKMWVDPIGPQNRWISVAERLPEDKDVVAVWTNAGDIHAAWRKDGAWLMFNPCCTYESELKDVSHWHHIADTPEEKEI